MNCPMRSGSSSGRCCRCHRVAGSGWTIEGSSTGSFGSSALGQPGGMCPSGTVRGPRCTPVSDGGRQAAPSSGCSGPPRRRPTPGPEKGASQPRTRTLPRWPDQQDSSRLRRLRPPARVNRHRRQHQRLHPVHRRDGSDTGAPHRPGTPPRAARPRPGRQGLQLQSHSHLAAAARHRPHHPRAGRPGPQPAPARQPRRAPPAFDKQLYKRRNVVERCFNRLKQWRGIATRYDKTAESYEAAVTLASLLMWA